MTLPFLTSLSPDQIAAHGVPGRWSFGYADQVRFAELDALNHVNNVAYLTWFETIRVRYVQDWGLTNYTDQDPMIVVRAQSAEYLSPLLKNQTYILAARTSAVRRTSFTMDYMCYANGIKATGQCVVVTLERDGKTKRVLPDDLLSKFREIDGITAP